MAKKIRTDLPKPVVTEPSQTSEPGGAVTQLMEPSRSTYGVPGKAVLRPEGARPHPEQQMCVGGDSHGKKLMKVSIVRTH